MNSDSRKAGKVSYSSSDPRRGRWIAALRLFVVLDLILAVPVVANVYVWFNEANKGFESLEQGQLVDARRHFESSCALTQIVPGDPRAPSAVRTLASLYYCRRQFDIAEELAQKAKSLDEKASGRMSVKYAQALSDIALGYRKQERYAESERIYRQSLEILDRLNTDKLALAHTLNGLSWVLIMQEKYQEAESLLLRSREEVKSAAGDGSFENILPLVELAYLKMKTGDEKQYGDFLNTAFDLSMKLGSEKPMSAQTVVALNLMGRLFFESEKKESALKSYELARKQCEICVFGGKYNMFMADILDSEARLHEKYGELDVAKDLKARGQAVRNLPKL